MIALLFYSIVLVLNFHNSNALQFETKSECLETYFNSGPDPNHYCHQCECKIPGCQQERKWVFDEPEHCKQELYGGSLVGHMKCTGSTIMDRAGNCVGKFKVIGNDNQVDYVFAFANDKVDCVKPNTEDCVYGWSPEPSDQDQFCDPHCSFPNVYDFEDICLSDIFDRNHPGDHGGKVSDFHCQKCQCKDSHCEDEGKWVVVNEKLNWHHTGDCKQISIPHVEMKCNGSAVQDGIGRCVGQNDLGCLYVPGIPIESTSDNPHNVNGGALRNTFDQLLLLIILGQNLLQ